MPFRGEPALVVEPIWTDEQKPSASVEADCVSLTAKSYGLTSVGDAFSYYETTAQSASRYQLRLTALELCGKNGTIRGIGAEIAFIDRDGIT